MKSFIAIVMLAFPVMAQDPGAVAAAGCGPNEVKFDVKTIKSHPIALPESGKALVYFIEEVQQQIMCIGGCPSTVKLGLDGTWVGANKGDSYFFLTVEPGDHHLCAGWQVQKNWTSRRLAATILTAEAGKTYVFLVKLYYGFDDPQRREGFVKLESVDNAEGQALIATRKFSVFRAKK